MNDYPLESKHKYKALVDFLRRGIADGTFSAGEKLDTEAGYSEKFKMSRQTVRHALSVLEKDGLITRRHGSGSYVRQQGQFRETTMTIGVIVSYMSEYIFPSIIRGIEEITSAAGYSFKLSATGNRMDAEKRILTSYLENPVDGLIVEGTKTAMPNPNIALYRRLEEIGVPVVFINGYYPTFGGAYVVTADREGGKTGAEYLISKGRSRFGGIFKADDLQGHERFAGFVEGLMDAGLEMRDDEAVWFTTESQAGLFSDGSATILKTLKDCDAVICYNDQIAINLINMLTKSGVKVPEDISVLSFDDSIYSDICGIKISSLAHPKEALGREATLKLLNMIDGKREVPLVMPFELREKEST